MSADEIRIKPLLEILNQPYGLFRRKAIESKLRALDSIAYQGTPMDIGHIFQFVLAPEKELSIKAAETVFKLFHSRILDTASWWNIFSGKVRYLRISPDEVSLLPTISDRFSGVLLGIASLNCSGYTREAAVELMKDLDHPEIIPFLLLRLPDWVLQVREKATVAFIKTLRSLPVESILLHYDLILWLERVQRINLLVIRQEIFKCLMEDDNRRKLLELIPAFPSKKRLFCWKALRQAMGPDWNLMDQIIADPAPEIRAWVVSVLPCDDKLKLRILTLLADKSARVRNTAIKLLHRHYDATFEPLLLPMIFDQVPSIRELARYILSKNGNYDFFSLYQARLLDSIDKPLPGTLAGYYETGTAEIELDLENFFSHTDSKIRQTALMGLARIKSQRLESFAVSALRDPSMKVKSTAVSILASPSIYFDRRIVHSLMKDADLPTRKACTKLLARIGGLEAALYTLIIMDEYSDLFEISSTYLTKWYYHYYHRAYFQHAEKVLPQIEDVITRMEMHDPDLKISLKNSIRSIKTLLKY